MSLFIIIIYKDVLTAAAAKQIIVISPIYGYHFNQEFHTERIGGRPTIVSTEGSGYQTGLFIQGIFNKLYITEYPFYARTNHSNVLGNILFSSYDFLKLNSKLKLNAGIGHVYHKIEAPGSIVKISVPMPKFGLKISAGNFKINPYFSRTRETNEIEAGNRITKKHYYYNLYGINIDYTFKHFWNHTLKYYYGDVSENDGNDIYTIRYYNYINLSKKYGAVLKYEYEKHKNGAVDKSITAGPVFMF